MGNVEKRDDLWKAQKCKYNILLKSKQVLYDYVDSLGSDVFYESDQYVLIQTFPYTIYSDKERTLEEEKLFPNAVLQIKEI